MPAISVIIPNYNGIQFLPGLFDSLSRQTFRDFEIILVDNGSEDDSLRWIREHEPQVQILALKENTGFAYAVNVGIQQSAGDYVLLLNNDTEADPRFIEELMAGMERHPQAFSCASRMIRFQDRGVLDDAGDFYNALGWAYARGKGKPVSSYEKEGRIFASCAGAALYRRSLLARTGLFDQEHFAYLEDIDLGYRARILGFENWYIPGALVYHVGSGTSGSRYNQFKTRYSSRNNIYMIRKNMPIPQFILNLPLLIPGFLVKWLFFIRKGMGREYLAGIKNGFQISQKNRKQRMHAPVSCFPNYVRIQLELWLNIFRFFTN